MNIKKIFWGLRSLLYKPFFGKYGMPSYMGKPIFISGCKNIAIGKRVRIFPSVRMEAIGEGKIEIHDDVAIGQNFHCTSAGRLIIGKKTTISGNVFITNIDHDYRMIDQHILEQPMLIRETRIGENCFIGYGASIQAGTILGKQCIVGTNSVVRGSFPDYSVIAGVPARVIKRYNHETKEWERVYENK